MRLYEGFLDWKNSRLDKLTLRLIGRASGKEFGLLANLSVFDNLFELLLRSLVNDGLNEVLKFNSAYR